MVNITIFAMDKAAMIVSGTTCVARSRTYTSGPSDRPSVGFGTISGDTATHHVGQQSISSQPTCDFGPSPIWLVESVIHDQNTSTQVKHELYKESVRRPVASQMLSYHTNVDGEKRKRLLGYDTCIEAKSTEVDRILCRNVISEGDGQQGHSTHGRYSRKSAVLPPQ